MSTRFCVELHRFFIQTFRPSSFITMRTAQRETWESMRIVLRLIRTDTLTHTGDSIRQRSKCATMHQWGCQSWHWRRLCAFSNCSPEERTDRFACINEIFLRPKTMWRFANERFRLRREPVFFLSARCSWIALTSLQANKIVYCARLLTCKRRVRTGYLQFKKIQRIIRFIVATITQSNDERVGACSCATGAHMRA